MEKNNFDIAVIGAGPAGMMAAGRAAELGARVVLLERNKEPGVKLLLTGNGRCNITNTGIDQKNLSLHYGKGGNFLFHSFHTFGPQEVIEFLNSKRVKTKEERGKRVFPVTDKAETVLNALLRYLRENEVTVICKAKVHRLSKEGNRVKKIILKDKTEIFADRVIICSGGKSYPATGSDGSGFRWASSFSHTIQEPFPALVPIKTKEDWVKELQGLSLKNIELTLKRKKTSKKYFGECMFTHYGMSGPLILKTSSHLREMLKKGEVEMLLDLKPGLTHKETDKRVQRDFEKYSNKDFKNSLRDLLPSKIIPVIVDLSRIDPLKETNKITKEERRRIVDLLKGLKVTVKEIAGFDLAITTEGGVDLSEIDEKTMKSKKIKNLFFAGEIIDLYGPTGGFNLQLCFSTGYLAGQSAVHFEK